MRSVFVQAGMVSTLALIVSLGVGMASPVHAAAKPATAPAVQPATPAANTGTAVAIMQATTALQTGKCDEALPFLEKLWDDAELQAGDPALAEQFRFQRVLCTLSVKGLPDAVALSTQNIAHVGATVTSYDLHVFLLLTAGDAGGAATTLSQAITLFPDSATKLTDITVMATLLNVEPERRRLILAQLQRAHWQIKDPSARTIIDYLRLDGLRAAVTAGDKELADLYRADIDDNAYIYAISQGDGFLSTASVPAAYDVPIARKQIADVKVYIANRPTDLQGMRYLVQLERSTDDHGLALVQLNGILQLIAANGLDKFESPNTYPYLISDRAQLLADLGKPADALAMFKEGAEKMKGPATFGFIMAYMQFLIGLGQDQDAIALDANVDFTSLDDNDKQVLALNAACAYGYLKDTMRYAQSLNVAAGGGELLDPTPFLCAGDTEGAAQALIRLINEPGARDAAILIMQDARPQIAYSERSKAMIAAMQALKKRPDVLAAASAQNIIVRSWQLRFSY